MTENLSSETCQGVVGIAESCLGESVTVHRNYIEAVRRGGFLPLVLAATDSEAEADWQLSQIDLLLLPGGGDLSAPLFGAAPLPTDGTPNLRRDRYELLLLRRALERRIPVFGICRGMQVINVALGGDLCQDLPSQWRSPSDGCCPLLEHRHIETDARHRIRIAQDSRLFGVVGMATMEVNSAHHQAVGRLGRSLRATAWSEDGVPEALESDVYPLAAVQFHPERMRVGDEPCLRPLFERLLRLTGWLRMLLVVLCCGLSASLQAQTALPEGFVYVADVDPDIMQEIRYATTYNFVGTRIPGYEAPVAILSAVAADSLRAVNRELMQMGYRLKVMDAYRPQRAVDFFVRWSRDLSDQRMKPYFYPRCPKEELFRRGYLAHRSGHTRGGTVDVTLFDMKRGCEVDMGSPYDLLDEASHYASVQGLSPNQIFLRRLLREVMMRHGFKPIACEWWHFTLRNEPFPFRSFDFPVR